VETVGTGVVAVVLTILLRDGGPALVNFLKARSEAGQSAAKDRRLESAEARKARGEDRDRDERADNQTIRELRELLDFRTAELEKERAESRRDRHDCVESVNALRTQLTQVREACARLEAYCEAYSDALATANIPHRRYVPPGSAVHSPLPPGAKP
jgi:chromosome segregation ATPase